MIHEFENVCQQTKHKKCKCCRMVRINLKVSKRSGLCEKCQRLKNANYYLEKGRLPVWRKDGVVMYHIPPELEALSQAEKMLIQRVSPFVPLHHIRQGTMGLSGHVCAFEQDINEFLHRLPRSCSDVAMLTVLKTIQTEIGGEKEAHTRAFRVRKVKVLQALEFLKKHNPEYKDIEIDMSTLDWIEGEEGILEGKQIVTEEIVTKEDDAPCNADLGPIPKQTIEMNRCGDNVDSYGYIDCSGVGRLSKGNATINEKLQDAVLESDKKKKITLDWPAVKSAPVSEYGDKRIFALAFPWLFPGGEGDVMSDEEGKEAEWGKRMLFYEDGRFAKDKIFTFFAMNYIIRRRNSSSGKWFVDSWQNNCPETLEELLKDIDNGNTSFINSLTYYTKRVKGSSAYWLQKRSELYTWINHHVEAGHGAPTFFITLSCAEHFWPDVIDLIKERLELAGKDTAHCYIGSPKIPQLVNDYAVVVQEYFQERVKNWLHTVGKDAFGIEHYWVRYEFAPGRGQIHAHLLAITSSQSIHQLCHTEAQLPNGKQRRSEVLGQWAADSFGLTASVCEGFDDLKVDKTNTPVRIRFKDVGQDDDCRKKDVAMLMKHVQVHDCSEFCLRKSSDKRQVKLQNPGC